MHVIKIFLDLSFLPRRPRANVIALVTLPITFGVVFLLINAETKKIYLQLNSPVLRVQVFQLTLQ